VIQYVESELDESLPERVELHDSEYSWQAFLMLDGFADGMGGWDFLQVFGKPVMELDDALIDDLLVYRNMHAIARREHEKQKREQEETDGKPNDSF
jgi:hypothetical protein